MNCSFCEILLLSNSGSRLDKESQKIKIVPEASALRFRIFVSRIINVTIDCRSQSYHQKHNCELSASTIAAQLQGPFWKREANTCTYIYRNEIRISRSTCHGHDRKHREKARLNTSHRHIHHSNQRAKSGTHLDRAKITSMYDLRT